uniref:Tribytltin binding protein type 1 n=1 Tax=Takifugu poecilonotus TaxID=176188 RepID=A0A0H5B133_9TELE|nr:tribytltin binding protein type 1 [Takifugu poecilonotus]
MMWFGIHFLFAGLVLTISALADEECRPLKMPKSLADHSVLFGKMHFIAGYTDLDVFQAILNITDSSWIEFSDAPGNPEELVMFESNKLNGNCVTSNINITIDGNKATASGANFTSEFQLLPSCDGCLALIMNTTIKNLDSLLKLMKIDIKPESNDVRALSFYLLANETSLPESDLENFKNQASCFGFTRDPDYQYDPKKAFCQKDEGVHILL